MRISWTFGLIGFLVFSFSNHAISQETFKPSDAIASVDGEPVFLGELNYLLMSKLRVKDLSKIGGDVQRASSGLLLKQHLAMRSLRQQGGERLQSILDRDWDEFVSQLKRRGVTLDSYAKSMKSDPPSIRFSRDWDSAWRGYLKSTMTSENLQRFYQRNAERYATARWDVSHLFIPVEDGLADADAIAKQKIEQLAEILEDEAGSESQLQERFAHLAKRESDGSTASEGGKIGWVSKPGDLPTTVMDAIQQTTPGSVTKPVRSPLGYHLVLVHDKSSTDMPFEQLEDLAPLRREAANALFNALVARQADAKVIWYLKQLRPPTADAKKD